MEIKHKILELLDIVQKTLRKKDVFCSIDIHYKLVKIPKVTYRFKDRFKDKPNLDFSNPPKYRERFILNVEGFNVGFDSFEKLTRYIKDSKYLEDMELEEGIKYSYVLRDVKGKFISIKEIT